MLGEDLLLAYKGILKFYYNYTSFMRSKKGFTSNIFLQDFLLTLVSIAKAPAAALAVSKSSSSHNKTKNFTLSLGFSCNLTTYYMNKLT